MLVAGGVLLLSACGVADGKREGGPAPGPTPALAADMAADTPVKLGDPYTVAGVTYTPADIPDYDDVGYASWYGEELAGKPTANGEIFNPDGISAAHRTLPLPSYVEVTALDTGRTILVRVNDRGPMVGDRLIDL
ncbi:MAG: septal ring lytic transglycosylase RlpA family protein, partial [Sphingopyxis sp.]